MPTFNSVEEMRKKLSYEWELIATCYHEAGHTLCGLLHFIKISETGICLQKDKRKEKDLGFTAFQIVGASDPIILDYLLKSEIYINYAGLAAEKIFYKEICGNEKLPMVLKQGSYLDRDNVSEIIKKHNLAPPGKKRHAYKNKLMKEVSLQLETYWSDLVLIVHQLFAKKTLSYDDLKSLLIKKSKNRTFWAQRFIDLEFLHSNNIGDEQKRIIFNI